MDIRKDVINTYMRANEFIVEAGGYVPVNQKEANDPRFELAISKDVQPGEVQRQAKKMGWKTDKAGVPPLLNASASKNSTPNNLFNLGM